uniref:Nucleoporin Nup159/Nup146 N-terminal domain-containing protein n=1 Tax=Stomoxys calcitrans TaxID=35570 RepID=A0A1I8P2U0_STOCA
MSGNNMLEVLFVSNTNDHQLSCSVWDYRTGTNLMNYKGGGGGAATHTLSVVRSEYLVAGNLTKPLLHVWPINAQEQMTAIRFVVAGAVSALALSPDATYMVAGIQETLYVWHVLTGRMMNTLSKHYQTVTCVKFTSDGSHFVSCGKDGAVLVWNLARVVAQEENLAPLYTFNDHGLPVTDVYVGTGGMRAYMFTVSLDRACKIYDLNSGTLLLSVVFAEGLQSVAVNALETQVFVGTNAGSIFDFFTNDVPRVKEYHFEEAPKQFVGHTKPCTVNCLALSADGKTLVSGGSDSHVLVWNISSRQLLKTLTFKGAITNLHIKLTNPAIFNPEHKQPQVFAANLKRMIDPEGAEEMPIEIMVDSITYDGESNYVTANYSPADTCCNPQFVVCGSLSNASTKSEDSEELKNLRQEVERLRHINKKLFEISSKQLLRQKRK